MKNLAPIALTLFLLGPGSARAWFIILPIPSFQKPAALNNLIDALEKSDETKALAYVSEDKTFGSKYWVWGHYAGHVVQSEADQRAIRACQQSLEKAKAATAGGKELYDFGTKRCELYEFANKSVSTRIPETAPVPSPTVIPATAPSTSNVSGSTMEAATETKGVRPAETPQTTATPAIAPVSPGAATTSGHEIQPASRGSTPAASPSASPSSPITPAGAGAGESQIARKLRELNDLRKEGLITQKDYDEKKKKLLEAM